MMKILLTRLGSKSYFVLLPQGIDEVQGEGVGLELRVVTYRTDFDDDKKKLHVKLVVKTCFRQRSLLLAGELADCWCLCSNHRNRFGFYIEPIIYLSSHILFQALCV